LVAKSSRQRRERLKAAVGTATTEQVEARVTYYGGCCAYCGGPFEAVEHVIPLARGGTGWASNLVPSCNPCNLAKRAKDPAPWIRLLVRRQTQEMAA
jgi:5-methylcytosine-specific restriction endonuclease McrA